MIKVSVIIMLGLFGMAHASPYPNSGGVPIDSTTVPITVVRPSSIPPYPVTRPGPPPTSIRPVTVTVAMPTRAPLSSIAPGSPPPGGHACVPIGHGGNVTYSTTPQGSFTAPGGATSVLARPSAVPFSNPPVPLVSVGHENWGKGTISGSASAHPVTATFIGCPDGYTFAYPTPVGTVTAIPSAVPSISQPAGGDGTTSAIPTPSTDTGSNTPQNLNADNDTSTGTGAAVGSFQISLVGAVLSGLATVAWMI
ncbi:hypothetical protein CVT24_004910 [Panaeolus cyanescens]|uniref:Uncharacterized protein n=1 Tax=Panaeolus cyanescens TaxID=181874 RepID=A0A409YB09_9AGAR|nr:hypothetical protein CVT24_004910 [Panaeolus cyanescens]